MWVVIQYNNDDNHDAETVGIFMSKDAAISKILLICEHDYTELKSNVGSLKEFIETDDRFDDTYDIDDIIENWSWLNFKDVLMEECVRNEGCVGFSYLNYKLSYHKIQGKI